MSKDEQLDYQRKVILEEYNEHLAIQKREVRDECNTEISTNHFNRDVQSRFSSSERRAL